MPQTTAIEFFEAEWKRHVDCTKSIRSAVKLLGQEHGIIVDTVFRCQPGCICVLFAPGTTGEQYCAGLDSITQACGIELTVMGLIRVPGFTVADFLKATQVPNLGPVL
jgi:hypothetical protein